MVFISHFLGSVLQGFRHSPFPLPLETAEITLITDALVLFFASQESHMFGISNSCSLFYY